MGRSYKVENFTWDKELIGGLLEFLIWEEKYQKLLINYVVPIKTA